MELSVSRIRSGKKYFQDIMRTIGLHTYESHVIFYVKFAQYAEKIHDVLGHKVYYQENFNVPFRRV